MARHLGVVVVLLAIAGACGSSRTFDSASTEARIRERLTESADVDVAAVTCPDSVEVEKEETFRCTARIEGADRRLIVVVRQTDEDGSLDIEPTRAVLITTRVEADIARVLDDRFERDDVSVACPGAEVRLEAPASTFACTAMDGSERKTVNVQVRDRAGTLTYRLR